MKITRRKFIGNIALGGAAVATFSLVACKGGKGTATTPEKKTEALACDDVSKLTEAEKKTRTALKYVESTSDGKTCESCTLYVDNGSGCGGCKIMKGSVHPKGSCASYSKKA